MTAATLNPPITPYLWNDQKIECFIQDKNAKNRLRDDLVPMNWNVGKPKINLAFILNVVEQFAEGLSQKRNLFSKSSFWNLLQPFSKSVGYILEYNPSKVTVQVTNLPSIYILAEIEGQNLHFDLHFNEETGKFEEAVVNIFSNKEQQLNVFGPIEEVIAEVDKHFEQNAEPGYEYYLHSSYAIPGQTYSSLAF